LSSFFVLTGLIAVAIEASTIVEGYNLEIALCFLWAILVWQSNAFRSPVVVLLHLSGVIGAFFRCYWDCIYGDVIDWWPAMFILPEFLVMCICVSAVIAVGDYLFRRIIKRESSNGSGPILFGTELTEEKTE
jgi:hypothetical protein